MLNRFKHRSPKGFIWRGRGNKSIPSIPQRPILASSSLKRIKAKEKDGLPKTPTDQKSSRLHDAGNQSVNSSIALGSNSSGIVFTGTISTVAATEETHFDDVWKGLLNKKNLRPDALAKVKKGTKDTFLQQNEQVEKNLRKNSSPEIWTRLTEIDDETDLNDIAGCHDDAGHQQNNELDIGAGNSSADCPSDPDKLPRIAVISPNPLLCGINGLQKPESLPSLILPDENINHGGDVKVMMDSRVKTPTSPFSKFHVLKKPQSLPSLNLPTDDINKDDRKDFLDARPRWSARRTSAPLISSTLHRIGRAAEEEQIEDTTSSQLSLPKLNMRCKSPREIIEEAIVKRKGFCSTNLGLRKKEQGRGNPKSVPAVTKQHSLEMIDDTSRKVSMVAPASQTFEEVLVTLQEPEQELNLVSE